MHLEYFYMFKYLLTVCNKYQKTSLNNINYKNHKY